MKAYCWNCAADREAGDDGKCIVCCNALATVPLKETVNHPDHYGGAANPYEAIKVIEAWGLGFNLGNSVKYISRAWKKDNALEDLKKARWYLDREITNMEKSNAADRR